MTHCRICSLDTEEAVIICGGNLNISSCKQAFHPKCLKMPKSSIKSVSHSNNIVWICNMCTNNNSDNGLVLGEKAPRLIKMVSEMKNEISHLLNELKREMIAEIDLRIRTNHSEYPHTLTRNHATNTSQFNERLASTTTLNTTPVHPVKTIHNTTSSSEMLPGCSHTRNITHTLSSTSPRAQTQRW